MVRSLLISLTARGLVLLRRFLARQWRQCLQLLAIGLLHARGKAVPGERLREHRAHARAFVGVVELIAAEPLADPAGHDALGVALRAELEGEIARRRRTGV